MFGWLFIEPPNWNFASYQRGVVKKSFSRRAIIPLNAEVISPSVMKTLVHQLLERAEAAGGEEWLWSCLALPKGQELLEASGENSEGSEEMEWDGGGALHNHVLSMQGEDPVEEDVEVGRQESAIRGKEEDGRRVGKRRRQQRRSFSPVMPAPLGGRRERSALEMGKRRAGYESSMRGGRRLNLLSQGRGASLWRQDRDGLLPWANEEIAACGISRGADLGADKASSAIPVRCESPMYNQPVQPTIAVFR